MMMHNWCKDYEYELINLNVLNFFFHLTDTQLKMYSLEDQRQLRSVSLSNMALSSVIITPDDKNALIASWDNSMWVMRCSRLNEIMHFFGVF